MLCAGLCWGWEARDERDAFLPQELMSEGGLWGPGVCLGLGEGVGWAASPGKTSQGEQRKEGTPRLSLRGQKAREQGNIDGPW